MNWKNATAMTWMFWLIWRKFSLILLKWWRKKQRKLKKKQLKPLNKWKNKQYLTLFMSKKHIIDKMQKAYDEFEEQIKELEKKADREVAESIKKIDKNQIKQTLQEIRDKF